jgi:hypothetical protein
MEALRLYTVGSSWFSREEGKKGAIAPGQFADLAVLSADYFSIPEEEIKRLESVLTMVGGKVVYATAEFSKLAPPSLPVRPDWSPVAVFNGYARASSVSPRGEQHSRRSLSKSMQALGVHAHLWVSGENGLWSLGCNCFAY